MITIVHQDPQAPQDTPVCGYCLQPTAKCRCWARREA